MPKFHLDRRAAVLVGIVKAGDPNELLTSPELADLLGVSIQFIEARVRENNGPRSNLIPPRLRRFRRGDVGAWLRERAAIFEEERANAS